MGGNCTATQQQHERIRVEPFTRHAPEARGARGYAGHGAAKADGEVHSRGESLTGSQRSTRVYTSVSQIRVCQMCLRRKPCSRIRTAISFGSCR
jgi:hypothetical protein